MYYPLFCGTYFVHSVSGTRTEIKEKGEGREERGGREGGRDGGKKGEGRGEKGGGRGRKVKGGIIVDDYFKSCSH